MRLFWLLIASLMLSGVAHAQAGLSPLVLEFRLGDRRVEALVWSDNENQLYAERATLIELGLAVPDGAADPIPLSDIRGLRYTQSDAQSAVIMSCSAQCYETQRLHRDGDERLVVSRAAGRFVNADLAATVLEEDSTLGGLFELGLFSRSGYGGTGFAADTVRGDMVRLESNWTFDFPTRRQKILLGDSFARGGASGVPFRFGGIQFGTDFTLDPGFVTFPTPTLNGEAAAPSTVDLYVDGVLRMRERVDAGAFSIVDAPVLSGGGMAQLVVTDALGRQQVFAQSFYSSPAMLRPGLADYAISIGAEREDFAVRSDGYGRGFVSALYRRGLTNYLTTEARIELADDHTGFAAAASLAHHTFGQIDLSAAANQSDGADGGSARLGWQQTLSSFSVGFEAEAATKDFQRLGEIRFEPAARYRLAGNVSADLGAFGVSSIAYTVSDTEDAEHIETIALSYSPRTDGRRQLFVNALYVEEDESYFAVTFGLSQSFGENGSAGAGVELENRRLAAQISAQRSPDPDGGVGWRVAGRTGENERFDAGLAHLGSRHEARLDVSATRKSNGVRAQYATGLAWIDGEVLVSRPVRESFALIDVGVPNVTVQRDRRAAGVTNDRGRLILTGLRPYEANRINVDMNDLPWDTQFHDDELIVSPAARSGAVARFARTEGTAGEVYVRGADGEPLAAGAILVRESDGARFPVGARGRVYVNGVTTPTLFVSGACAIIIGPQQIGANADLQCAMS